MFGRQNMVNAGVNTTDPPSRTHHRPSNSESHHREKHEIRPERQDLCEYTNYQELLVASLFDYWTVFRSGDCDCVVRRGNVGLLCAQVNGEALI